MDALTCYSADNLSGLPLTNCTISLRYVRYNEIMLVIFVFTKRENMKYARSRYFFYLSCSFVARSIMVERITSVKNVVFRNRKSK